MLTVIDSYLAAKDSPLDDLRFLHTLGAIMENKLGHTDAALKHLAAIGSNPDPALWYLHPNLKKLVRESHPQQPSASPPLSPSASPASSPAAAPSATPATPAPPQ